MCSELLHNQDFCAVQRGVAVNVLRVLQCRNHMGDVFAFARTAMRNRGGAARSSGKASPWLAFVSGELDQLATFVRAGMRLPGFTETGSACHQGLTITSYLAEGVMHGVRIMVRNHRPWPLAYGVLSSQSVLPMMTQQMVPAWLLHTSLTTPLSPWPAGLEFDADRRLAYCKFFLPCARSA